jgi:hypothetical protein
MVALSGSPGKSRSEEPVLCLRYSLRGAALRCCTLSQSHLKLSWGGGQVGHPSCAAPHCRDVKCLSHRTCGTEYVSPYRNVIYTA